MDEADGFCTFCPVLPEQNWNRKSNELDNTLNKKIVNYHKNLIQGSYEITSVNIYQQMYRKKGQNTVSQYSPQFKQ